MKKVLLLCALVCAGQMYGMEQWSLPKIGHISELPEDIHNEIIKIAFKTSDNVDDVIKAIEGLGAVYGVQYNIKEFTKLVHILANKFDSSTYLIAKKFTTSTAKKYLELGQSLLNTIASAGPNQVDKLINDGADINFISFNNSTPLSIAVQYSKNDIIKLLLEAGANPNFKNPMGSLAEFMKNYNVKDETKQLIQKAMNQ